MPAMDALHMQNIYSDDLVANSVMHGYMENYMESMQGSPSARRRVLATANEMGGPGQIPIPSPGSWLLRYPDAGNLRLNLSKWLEAGLTYYVDPKMFQLITAASESMPQETVIPRDIPSDFGFMWIPGGLAVIDVRGQMLKYHAVQWAAFGGKISIVWLTDKNDLTDSTNLVMRSRLSDREMITFPRLAPGGFTELEFGSPLPLTPGPDFLLPPEARLDVYTQENPDGSTSLALVTPKGFSPEELQEKMSFGIKTDPAARWLLTTWRLMQQSIASVTEEKAPRQLRKQLEKKNLDTKVTVIGLRRRESRGEGDTEVDWSHRWLVRGHWRNQPVKEDGEWTTRLIYIHPHIKGPEDKPLILREHVYALVR